MQVAIGRGSQYEPHITVQRSIVSFLIFLSVALGIVASAHYYIWVRLVRDVAFAPGLRRLLGWGVVLLALSVPATFILSRTLPPNNGRWLLHVTYTWMGVLLLLVVALGLTDLVRLLSSLVFAQGPSAQPERRLFLRRLFAGAATLATGTTSVLAINEGLARVKIKNVRIPLARLPASMHGFTIVQLTDVHMGPTLRAEFARDVVARVNALDADLIAITGDLVDGSVDRLGPMVSIFGNLRARHGVYFVTGNHEYYSGVDEWLVELKRIGIRVLRNERVSIGSPEASFDLIGIDDAHAHQFGNGHGADLPKATLGRDPMREAVLLAHQPRAVYQAQQHGIGLQLSGHTHGGQLWPFNYLVHLQQPVIKGLEKIGDVWLYVSTGTGYWGPPMRLAAPAEITRVTLASSKLA